jgi:Flp pilus assembly protein TadB
MHFPKSLTAVIVPVGSLALVVVAYRSYAWPGVAMAAGALVMWLLLHFTRMLQILKRAADRPIGFVDSAVMLNAKLRSGLTLMHVVALTRALGALQSPKDTQPEVFRWTDASDSSVTCTFVGGKLTHWELQRPAADQSAP